MNKRLGAIATATAERCNRELHLCDWIPVVQGNRPVAISQSADLLLAQENGEWTAETRSAPHRASGADPQMALQNLFRAMEQEYNGFLNYLSQLRTAVHL